MSMVGLTTYYQDERGLHFVEFVADETVPVMEPFCATCKVQAMPDGTLNVSERPARSRSQSTLISKAAHGRLSGTKDKAVQLTLKAFRSEGIDWQRAFVCETVELMTCLMGHGQMSALLRELLMKTEEAAR
ncbi:MAG: hypothetical protein IJ544_09485 [Prevotella sp.]|nr:hypothetical protein [Prevotella sp.]